MCQLDHLLVQVLDDSDDETLMLLIKAEVSKWSKRGVNIVCHHRLVRTGYKAGNLKSAMSCDYVKNYEFVAIFDADFQPSPDFLKQRIPHFKVPNLNLNSMKFSSCIMLVNLFEVCDAGKSRPWIGSGTVEVCEQGCKTYHPPSKHKHVLSL